jgi:hypothetical protein
MWGHELINEKVILQMFEELNCVRPEWQEG